MGLNLLDLDEATREEMLKELQYDTERGGVWLSDNLNEKGRADYPDLMEAAARSHDDDWLAMQIADGRLNSHEKPRLNRGTVVTPKMRSNAHTMLAEGEFNRLYARGLCRRAIAEGIGELEVYRAKAVEHPRTESVRMIGQRVDPKQLLEDLRESRGMDTALRLPPGPNSGLSVKLP